MWTTTFEYAATGHSIKLQVFGRHHRQKRGPALLYFHDGLFNQGQIESAHALAEALSDSCVVVCVDYPLAPRVQFPQSIEVAYQALQWLSEHAKVLGANAKLLFVGGERAGGNLAAVTALLYRDRGLRAPAQLQGQVLINPMLDALQTSPSLARLTESPCRAAWADYAPCPSLAWHPYVSPVQSCRLAGLVNALIISEQGHPLVDEAAAYAKKLLLAGGQVQHWCVSEKGWAQHAPLIRQWMTL